MVVPLRKRTKGWREENAFVIKGCGREGFKETFCDFKFSFQWLVRGFFAIFACDHAILDAMNNESCFTIGNGLYLFGVVFGLSSWVESWSLNVDCACPKKTTLILECAS